eukprot:GHRR01020558.1.p1 GENE.GHRR01020558.1~~GHRR01020558.1.p1  ORF type:complete len:311 (+),score=94.39 GHRR01020558.1:302-1234(+)
MQGHGYGPPPPHGYQHGQPPMGPPSHGTAAGSGPNSFPGYQQQQYQQLYQQQQPQMPHVNSYPGMQQPMQQNPYQPRPASLFVPQQQAHQGFSMPPYQPSPPVSTGPQMPVAPSFMGGAGGSGGFMSGLSPMNLMTGGLLSAPQQYMQQRVSWLKTNMTGGTMSALFNISNSYVASKLLMLLTPFLGKWTYTRMHEQIAGGQRYRPPSVDVNAPDLFIPLMGLWSYALLSCIVLASKHTFTPESMSKTLWSASSAWFVHWFVVWLLLKVVNVPGVAWSELTAYTGYPFVAVCLTTLGGFLAGGCLPGMQQ